MNKFVTALIALAVSGCDPSVDESLLSKEPASSDQFAAAQDAAAVCSRTAPNWNATEVAFKQLGFAETQDPRLQAIQKAQKAVILQKPSTDLVILVGSRGGEGACIVGLIGMTPQQSFQLAQPWVQKYGALTNEERGQGLAKNAIQAWGVLEEDRIVYLAAFKTWDVLGVPGSAAQLLYIER